MNIHPAKEFMEDVWGAEGDFIDTPLGRGRIENVRTKAGIELFEFHTTTIAEWISHVSNTSK